MYNQHLEVKTSRTGLGVFAMVQIPAGVPVIEFTGDIIPKSKLNIDPSQYLQVGAETFIGPSSAIDDYINHNCDPNCLVHVVGNRAILYSMYVIARGAELNFDYSTTSTDTWDSWKMDCKCGSYKCRRIISGYQYLSDDLKKEYIQKDMIPEFITNPGLFQKRW